MSEPYRVLCHQDDRETWLQMRREGVGASEVAALLGCDPYCDAAQLLDKKLGASDTEQNKFMFWGCVLESAIIEGYGKIGSVLSDYSVLGTRTPKPWGMLLQSTRVPELRATPDAEQHCSSRGCTGVLQIKTASRPCGQLPDHYRIQVQAELAVTGLTWGTLAMLINGRDFRYWDIERDEKLIDEIFDKVTRFWRLVAMRRAA